MMVLVDTSVWVTHFKQRDEQLVALLQAGRVVCHPHIVVEVACGSPPRRRDVVHMLGELESTPVATPAELLNLLEHHALFGRGCAGVDAALLAATRLSGQARLWTLDKRLQALAVELGCAYRPALAS